MHDSPEAVLSRRHPLNLAPGEQGSFTDSAGQNWLRYKFTPEQIAYGMTPRPDPALRRPAVPARAVEGQVVRPPMSEDDRSVARWRQQHLMKNSGLSNLLLSLLGQTDEGRF